MSKIAVMKNPKMGKYKEGMVEKRSVLGVIADVLSRCAIINFTCLVKLCNSIHHENRLA